MKRLKLGAAITVLMIFSARSVWAQSLPAPSAEIERAAQVYLNTNSSPVKIMNASTIIQKSTDKGVPKSVQVANYKYLAKAGVFKTDAGMELLVNLQSSFDNEYGPTIRENSSDPRLRREGAIYTGTILGFFGRMFYSKTKFGLVHDFVKELLPYAGLLVGSEISRNYNPNYADGVPPSPLEIAGFGIKRPEESGWGSGEKLSWKIAEVLIGISAFPLGQSAADHLTAKFLKGSNCLEAGDYLLRQYSIKTRADKIFANVKAAGLDALSQLRGIHKVDWQLWKDAVTLTKDERDGIREYTKEWAKSLGPVGVAGGLATFVMAQMALDQVGHHRSTAELRDEIMASQNRLERFNQEGRTKELELEAYRFRTLVEYYSDVVMWETTETTPEVITKAFLPTKNIDAQLAERQRLAHAIEKTYSKTEWRVFKARVDEFFVATEEYTEQQMPPLYKEVMSDGLPYDAGNILLYGAAVLHKNKLMSEFERSVEKIRANYQGLLAVEKAAQQEQP